MSKKEIKVFIYCRVGNREQLSKKEQKDITLNKSENKEITI